MKTKKKLEITMKRLAVRTGQYLAKQRELCLSLEKSNDQVKELEQDLAWEQKRTLILDATLDLLDKYRTHVRIGLEHGCQCCNTADYEIEDGGR